jgi:hypothetical protein
MGVGEQCGKVTLPHCSPPSSAEGAELDGENERGKKQRGRSRGGGVRGVDAKKGFYHENCITPRAAALKH